MIAKSYKIYPFGNVQYWLVFLEVVFLTFSHVTPNNDAFLSNQIFLLFFMLCTVLWPVYFKHILLLLKYAIFSLTF